MNPEEKAPVNLYDDDLCEVFLRPFETRLGLDLNTVSLETFDNKKLFTHFTDAEILGMMCAGNGINFLPLILYRIGGGSTRQYFQWACKLAAVNLDCHRCNTPLIWERVGNIAYDEQDPHRN